MSGNFEHLKAGIDAALASPHTSAWEANFLRDMQSRYERYGERTRLSDKQRSTLFRILGRSLPPPQPVTLRPHPRVKPVSFPQRRQRPTFVQRKVRWWGRRFVRDATMAAAVALVFALFMVVASVSSLWQPNGSTVTSSEELPPKSSNPGKPPRFTITDGDTIHIAGEENGTRLVGFNTPEKFSPQCAREEQLAHRATARLKELVSTSSISLTKVACSCRPGTEGTKKCNYGRSCAILKANGQSVGDILISEGLAAPFVCGPNGCPPTPRPWCG